MLTTTSEYAIRALGYLAQSNLETKIGSDEISEATRVPKRFLLKILNTLKNQGLLNTSRGIGGGFSLAKEPFEISLHEVVSVFEDINRHDHCLLGHDICNSDDPCPLHSEWKIILNQLENFLRKTTLKCFSDSKDKHIFYKS